MKGIILTILAIVLALFLVMWVFLGCAKEVIKVVEVPNCRAGVTVTEPQVSPLQSLPCCGVLGSSNQRTHYRCDLATQPSREVRVTFALAYYPSSIPINGYYYEEVK